MSRFYVVHGRRILLLIGLLIALVLCFLYVFEPAIQQEKSKDEELDESSEVWRQFAPQSLADSGDDQIIEVFFPTPTREVAELDYDHVVSVTPVPTRFSEYRMERERVRSRQTELLESIVYGDDVSEDRKSRAQSELMQLVELMTTETEIENLLKAKGHLDGVVMIGTDSVTVVVPSEISKDDASQIGELITRMTGVRLDRITIVDEPVKM